MPDLEPSPNKPHAPVPVEFTPTAVPRPAPSTAWRIVKWGMAIVLLMALLGGGSVAGAFIYYDRDLPKFDALTDYRPKQVTQVYCADGSLCGEYFHERRTVLAKEEIPELLKKAVISAEDA